MTRKKSNGYNNTSYYSTENELRFVEDLGRGIHGEASHPGLGKKRIVFLKGYRKACRKRFDWSNLDRPTIMAAVEKEIEMCKC
jgi:hypothetical protein